MNGGWSTWSPWSQCSHPCMIKMRTRECTNPPPENGGLNCTGTKVEQFPCGSAVECQSKDTIYIILQYFFKWVKLNIYFYSFMNWTYTVFFTSIGTLRSNNATATRTSLFQPLSRLFLPTYFEKCRRTLLKINSKGPYPSCEGKIKFRCCLFAFSIKAFSSRRRRAITAKKCTKKCEALANLLFGVLNLIVFLKYSLLSGCWILKSLLVSRTNQEASSCECFSN